MAQQPLLSLPILPLLALIRTSTFKWYCIISCKYFIHFFKLIYCSIPQHQHPTNLAILAQHLLLLSLPWELMHFMLMCLPLLVLLVQGLCILLSTLEAVSSLFCFVWYYRKLISLSENLDLLFLVDCTGSMGPILNEVQAKIQAIINVIPGTFINNHCFCFILTILIIFVIRSKIQVGLCWIQRLRSTSSNGEIGFHS